MRELITEHNRIKVSKINAPSMYNPTKAAIAKLIIPETITIVNTLIENKDLANQTKIVYGTTVRTNL